MKKRHLRHHLEFLKLFEENQMVSQVSVEIIFTVMKTGFNFNFQSKL